VCEEPDELDCAFIAPTDYTNFLWTSELFVTRQPLDGVPKRPRESAAILIGRSARSAPRSPASAKAGIVGGFSNSPVKREELLGAH